MPNGQNAEHHEHERSKRNKLIRKNLERDLLIPIESNQLIVSSSYKPTKRIVLDCVSVNEQGKVYVSKSHVSKLYM